MLTGLPTPPSQQVWNDAQQMYFTRQCPGPCAACIEDCGSLAFCMDINTYDLPRFTSLEACQANTGCKSSCMQCNATHFGCFTYDGG